MARVEIEQQISFFGFAHVSEVRHIKPSHYNLCGNLNGSCTLALYQSRSRSHSHISSVCINHRSTASCVYPFCRRTRCQSWAPWEARCSATLPRQGAIPARPRRHLPLAGSANSSAPSHGPCISRPEVRSSYIPRCDCPPCTCIQRLRTHSQPAKAKNFKVYAKQMKE